MSAEQAEVRLAAGALRTVRALLPGCSVAAGLVRNPARTLRYVDGLGRDRGMLLEGQSLVAAYRSMRERSTQMIPFEEDRPGGRQLFSTPINGLDGLPIGALQVLTEAKKLPPSFVSALEAVTQVIGDTVQQHRLNRDLQHSLNQLFLVYEVGRLFNLASSLDEVLLQVRDQLSGTLNFHTCCIMLLNERRTLVPEAGIGIDSAWMQEARPALSRSVAARVLEAGAAVQITDPVELGNLEMPLLENGLPPASVLSAPLRTRMGMIGVLELYTAAPYAFSVDEVFLLSVLAAEVATAVENSQLYVHIREKEGRLTVLAHKLIHSQEEERRRIARDMHDGLAQMIVSAYQYLQAHAFSVADASDRHSLERGMALLTECIDESRNVIFDLRPSTLDDFGLVLALRQYLSQLETDLGWQVEFSLVGQVGPLPAALETAIFRMVKEALTNAKKHARAERVLVRLAAKGKTMTITVRDWGQGFNPREASTRRNGQLGLMGMKERVALLNGTFSLRSKPGTGTLIRITLPLE
ncbi:MAG TPA: GAF domain-containing sensor histidine kinase [Chloroflexota bacterium]|jgi:signal transduction histidine kinase